MDNDTQMTIAMNFPLRAHYDPILVRQPLRIPNRNVLPVAAFRRDPLNVVHDPGCISSREVIYQ